MKEKFLRYKETSKTSTSNRETSESRTSEQRDGFVLMDKRDFGNGGSVISYKDLKHHFNFDSKHLIIFDEFFEPNDEFILSIGTAVTTLVSLRLKSVGYAIYHRNKHSRAFVPEKGLVIALKHLSTHRTRPKRL